MLIMMLRRTRSCVPPTRSAAGDLVASDQQTCHQTLFGTGTPHLRARRSDVGRTGPARGLLRSLPTPTVVQRELTQGAVLLDLRAVDAGLHHTFRVELHI